MRGRPRKVPRDDSGDPRAQIVAAATRLFARRGIGATTMAEIAEAAGLGTSSLYYWFRSKQQILEVIVEDVNREPLEAAEALADADGHAADRLHELVHRDVLALCALPFDINEVHRLAGDGDEELARYWSDRQRLVAAVERIVADGVAAGELRAVDPHLAALTILANDEATQHWFRSLRDGGGYDPETIATFTADIVRRGLLT